MRIVLCVVARVPALHGHVDPAAHGQAVVEDRDLLVVAAPRGMGAVELEVDPAVPHPAHQVPPHGTTHDELEDAEAPFEDTDFKRRPVTHQPRKETAQPRGKIAPVGPLPPAAPIGEVDARVEIPADQENAMLCVEHRFLHGGEIVRRIDDHARALDLLVTPHARLDAIVEPGHALRVDRFIGVVPHPLGHPIPWRPLSSRASPRPRPSLPSSGVRTPGACASCRRLRDNSRSPGSALPLPRRCGGDSRGQRS